MMNLLQEIDERLILKYMCWWGQSRFKDMVFLRVFQDKWHYLFTACVLHPWSGFCVWTRMCRMATFQLLLVPVGSGVSHSHGHTWHRLDDLLLKAWTWGGQVIFDESSQWNKERTRFHVIYSLKVFRHSQTESRWNSLPCKCKFQQQL